MTRSKAVVAATLAGLLVAVPVSAGPLYTGDTSLLGAPTAGSTLMVRATIDSVGPVVPYEFQVQNECQLPDRGGRTLQRDGIASWPERNGDDPQADLPIYLQSIESGAKCKVFLTRGNVQVKGSVTSYTVQ